MKSLTLPNRIVAGLLAAIWLAAGLVTIGFGIAGRHWLPLVPGFAAIWYGLLWVRVTVEGHLLSGSGALLLWRRKHN